MRKDMSKVLVERPRRGSRNSNSDGQRQIKGRRKNIDLFNEDDLEKLPSKESTSRHRQFGWDCKELNEFLAPLRRFLDSCVGRPWDEVYSEVRKDLNPNSAIHFHILQHLEWYMEKVQLVGTEVWSMPPHEGPINDRWQGRPFYVHPETGLLCRSPERSYKYKKPEPQYVTTEDKMIQCHKVDDIWYFLHLEDCAKHNATATWVRDSFSDIIHGLLEAYECKKYYGMKAFCTKKVQMNKKNIKKYKIKDFEATMLEKGITL